MQRCVAIGRRLIHVDAGLQQRLHQAVVAGDRGRAQQRSSATLLHRQDVVGGHALDRLRLAERKGDVVEASRLAIGGRAVGLDGRLLPQVARLVLQHQHLFAHGHPVLPEGGDDSPDQLRANSRLRTHCRIGAAINVVHEVAQRGWPRLRYSELEQLGNQLDVLALLIGRNSLRRDFNRLVNLALSNGGCRLQVDPVLEREPPGLGACERPSGEERLRAFGKRPGVRACTDVKEPFQHLLRLGRPDHA
eukprot:scaffold50_cov107-Isochrysis_galbana.AAC.4